LAACVALLIQLPALLEMVENGEISVLKAAPVVLGVVLLAIASMRLLIRRATRGKWFLVAAAFLLLGQIGLPTIEFSYWLWLATSAALAGAVIGLRTPSSQRPTA